MGYLVLTTKTFRDWHERLVDDLAASAIAKRLVRIELGNLGDVKPVGGGVSELQIHYGPGFRLYFHIRGNQVVLLLCGGDKSSQRRDIELAKQLAKTWDRKDA